MNRRLRYFIDDDRHGVDIAQIDNDFVPVLHGDFHRYLGRQLCLNRGIRIDKELSNRISLAWDAFNKHKYVLLDQSVSLEKCLKYFDTCVSPVIQFELVVLPMTQHKLEQLNIVQRQIHRRIIDWRRLEAESWEDTIRKMKK